MLILIFALVCVPACSGCQSAPKDEVLTIVHATDMHFLSPKLTDYSQDFIDFLSRTDGKVTQYSPQICEAFVADMLEMKPDAVILSGDLTLNGAYESHSDLAAVLMPLKEAGIAVFVLPGNHDAGGAAYSFFEGRNVVLGFDFVKLRRSVRERRLFDKGILHCTGCGKNESRGQ